MCKGQVPELLSNFMLLINHNICILEPCTEIVADSNSLLIKLQKIFDQLSFEYDFK